jgi:preprotein translocase subunit SecA
MVSRQIEGAQSRVEGANFDTRRHVVEYDDVMNTQRQIIYGERRRILEGVDTRGNVLSFIRDMIADTVPGYADARHKELWDLPGLFEHLGQIIPLPTFEQVDQEALGNSPDSVIEAIYDMVEQAYEALEQQNGPEALRFMERWTMLHVIDQRWIAYLTTMEHLKEAIGLQGYAQKDPLVEYKNEAFSAFEQLKRDIQFEIATTIFRVRLERTEPPPQQPIGAGAVASGPSESPGTGVSDALAVGGVPAQPNGGPGNGARPTPAGVPAAVGAARAESARPVRGRAAAPRAASGKVGRNDPCPCGSGRKYKRCHGR